VTPLNGTPPLNAVEAALLIAELRRLWRTWQERAGATSTESVAAAYRGAMRDLAAVLQERDRRYRSWVTLREDVARAVAAQFPSNPPSV
jgi:hypothetical protein